MRNQNNQITIKLELKLDRLTYNLIECDQKLDCVVYKPNQESVFEWEYCPAYKEYDVV